MSGRKRRRLFRLLDHQQFGMKVFGYGVWEEISCTSSWPPSRTANITGRFSPLNEWLDTKHVA